MKIIPCLKRFEKDGKYYCLMCDTFYDNQFCHGIFYYFYLLKIKIRYIKLWFLYRIHKNHNNIDDDIPF